jgi:tetratricopeptide (TPR) repeat protein
MKHTSTLFLIAANVLLIACTQSNGAEMTSNANSTSPVPALIERTSNVGVASETAQLHKTYANLKDRLSKQPDDLKSWIKLSEVFITEARITGNYGPNYDAATSILDKVLEQTSSEKKREIRSEALTLKAVIKLSEHQFEEARSLGEEAIALDPNRAFNYGVLVDANVELGDYAKAVVMSDKMVGMRPDLRSYSRVSYLREIHGDIPGAIQAMDMAVKAGYPGAEETSWCRVQLGGIHERNGDLAKANEHYMQALAERGDYPFALAAAGRVAGKQKDFARAETFLKDAIKRMPDAHFHADLARVYAAQNKQAEYAQERAITEDILVGLSGAHDHSEGADHASHGHSHEVGLEMARFELEFHKDLPVALANAEHEFEHRENNIDVNAAMAAILYAKGDFGAAQTHLDMAKATGSKSADLLLIGGLIRIAKGDKVNGKKLVKAAFSQDPYLQHALAAEGRAVI